MEDKQLTPSSSDLIPIDGGGPSIEPWWQRVWRRVSNWFDNVSWGGIYDTRVDRSHYDRWWWSWHLISDPSEIMGQIGGWAGRVYDYFENWINPAHETFQDKFPRLAWNLRGANEGGIYDEVKDTYDRFKNTFSSFRDNPANFIYDRLPQWIKDLKSLWDNAWNWIYDRIPQEWKDAWKYLKEHITDITNFFTNLYTTIKDFLGRIWAWLWEHFEGWVKDILTFLHDTWTKVKDFFTNLYTRVADFLSRVWAWIYEHIPQELKDIWNNAKTWWDWLRPRWDKFTLELGKFLDDPYVYITTLLQAWIEGWRDYILGVVRDLFQTFEDHITDEVVRFIVNLFPRHASSPPQPEEYADFDSLIEDSLYWLEGDGAKQLYGYDDLVAWTAEEVFKEPKPLPHGL